MISDYMHSSDIKMSKPIIHTAVDKYVKTKNEHCIVLTLNDVKTDIAGFGANVWTDVFESEGEIVDQLTRVGDRYQSCSRFVIGYNLHFLP